MNEDINVHDYWEFVCIELYQCMYGIIFAINLNYSAYVPANIVWLIQMYNQV